MANRDTESGGPSQEVPDRRKRQIWWAARDIPTRNNRQNRSSPHRTAPHRTASAPLFCAHCAHMPRVQVHPTCTDQIIHTCTLQSA